MKLFPLLIAVAFFAFGCSSSNNEVTTDGPDATAATSLFDTVWEIEIFTDSSGQLADVAPETKYQFLFESGANSMQAFVGCVNFSDSSYVVSDGFVNFTLGARDGVVCINETEPFMEQDAAIMSLISGGEPTGSVALMFIISEDRLELEAADGRRLELVAVDELMQQE